MGQNNLISFTFQDKPVRVAVIENEPWWIACDVCNVMGIEFPCHADAGIDEDERSNVEVLQAEGQYATMVAVSGFGLLSLISRSQKPDTKLFRRWINHEVLPQIRQVVSNSISQKSHGPLTPEETAMLRAISAVLPKTTMELRNITEKLTEIIKELKGKN